MVRALDAGSFLALPDVPVIDVRSPGEFARGHIPGAQSLPLFTDAERAVVGTLYKQQGRDAAVLEGLRIVGPRLASMTEDARAIAPSGRIRVHCWRGGERSGSVAWLLDKAGFTEVLTLKGGYKAFRHHVLDAFQQPRSLRILGGFTGSGKTGLLRALHDVGEQVIDLEALAGHKGSSFGMLGQPPQPTTEQFENRLWVAFEALDPLRPLWIEDESPTIGRVALPHALYAVMQEAPLYFIERPVAERAERLAREYGIFPKEELAAALVRIRKRLGPQHCKAALEALEAGDLRTTARIALQYYDKTYLRSLSARAEEKVRRIVAHTDDLADLADQLIAHVRPRS